MLNIKQYTTKKNRNFNIKKQTKSKTINVRFGARHSRNFKSHLPQRVTQAHGVVETQAASSTTRGRSPLGGQAT